MKSIFIAEPAVSFTELLQALDEILGHKVTHGVDNTSKILSDSERFLSILSSIKDAEAPVGLSFNLLTHVSFSVLTVASDVDMMDVLECCSGMPFTSAETKIRGMLVAIITGTMQQWRDAVVVGTKHKEPLLREGFNNIHNLFVQSGLGQVWNDFEQQTCDDGTYILIEYKP